MSRTPHTHMSQPVVAGEDALERALQRSETRRLFIMFLILLAGFGLAIVRWLLDVEGVLARAFPPVIALLSVATLYTLLLMILTRRCSSRGTLLPSWVWAGTVFFESLIPTALLLIVQRHSPVGPLGALSAPGMLLYGIFIIASVLRLRPMLSLLGGLTAALGHVWLFMHVVVTQGHLVSRGDFPYYLTYPAVLVLMGAAAAFVSREVRKHLQASLREAETRRQLGLVQKEMEIARSVQQGLMPRTPPAIPGYDIAGWNCPASRTGGDYYDWQPFPDGRIALVIADVTGHGLGPALLMAVCRAYARACMPERRELSGALGRVNALLEADIGDGRFVTLAAAVLDPKDGSVELLSAGHGPILFYRAETGQVDQSGGDGPPLGVLADQDYGKPKLLQMTPGDMLLLVTDGFVEWARSGDNELYGVDRLAEFLRANATLDGKSFIEALAEDVRRFGEGSPQNDDMTALIIRRL